MPQLPAVEHWAIAGDFNMLEDGCDRLGGTFQPLFGSELLPIPLGEHLR